MKEMVVLCLAVGIEVRNLEPIDVFAVAGKIIHDAEIHTLHVASGNGEMNMLDIITNMTPVQRRDLRERALGVVPIRRTP